MFRAIFKRDELRGCNVLGKVEGKGQLDETRVRWVEKIHKANSSARSDVEKEREWKKGVAAMNHEICRQDSRERAQRAKANMGD